MAKKKWHWETITYENSTECISLEIVSDALVATGRIADGRLLPVLLVDCSSRTDVEDLIKVHANIAPGDVKIMWGKSSKTSKTIKLILSFERPSKCKAVLDFDILRQGGIVDQIMRCEAFILQCGKKGERFISTIDREKIVVEVPSRDALVLWNEELYKALEADGRRMGMDKKQAKEYSSGVIKRWRELGDHRM